MTLLYYFILRNTASLVKMRPTSLFCDIFNHMACVSSCNNETDLAKNTRDQSAKTARS